MNGGADQHRPSDIGQDMTVQNCERTDADEFGRLKVFFVAFDHGAAANRASLLHPTGYADSENQDIQGQLIMHIAGQQATRHAVYQQGDQDGWKG